MTATAPAKQPRDYQFAALTAIGEARARGVNRQLLSAATGAGKTEIFSFLIKEEIAADRTSLVLAHRDRLVTQAASRIEGIVGRGHIGLVNGRRKDWWKRCVVATVQSAAVGKQLERAPKFDTIIVDECHRSRAPQYKAVIDRLLRPGGLLLGVTATPNRTDKKGLIPEVYQEVVYEIGMQELIDRGFLCPVIGKEIKLPIDFSKIHTATSTDGIRDYKPKEVQAAFEEVKWLERITIGWKEFASDRRTIIFVPPGIVDGRNCGMAHSLAEYMRLQGISAAAVDGTTNKGEQDRIIADFTAGRIQVLVNVNIFTEGLDIPPIDCVLFARPTQSSIIYSQAIGRGSRLILDLGMLRVYGMPGGKKNLLVIDVTGITEQLQASGQSLMTLGRVLPTEEQRVSLKAERMKFAKGLMRKLWRKAITLKLSEDRKIQVFGEIGVKEKAQLEEYADEITEILQKRDAGEEEGNGAGSKPVNNSLLTSDRIEVREIDFGQAGIKFDWQFDRINRKAWIDCGSIQYHIERPDPDGRYFIHWPITEMITSEETWHEAKARVENRIGKDELKKRQIFSDPSAPWTRTPASDAQKQKLRQFKIPFAEGITKGEASRLLQPIFDRFNKRRTG